MRRAAPASRPFHDARRSSRTHTSAHARAAATGALILNDLQASPPAWCSAEEQNRATRMAPQKVAGFRTSLCGATSGWTTKGKEKERIKSARSRILNSSARLATPVFAVSSSAGSNKGTAGGCTKTRREKIKGGEGEREKAACATDFTSSSSLPPHHPSLGGECATGRTAGNTHVNAMRRSGRSKEFPVNNHLRARAPPRDCRLTP